jgi:hypothetical protein
MLHPDKTLQQFKNTFNVPETIFYISLSAMPYLTDIAKMLLRSLKRYFFGHHHHLSVSANAFHLGYDNPSK